MAESFDEPDDIPVSTSSSGISDSTGSFLIVGGSACFQPSNDI